MKDLIEKAKALGIEIEDEDNINEDELKAKIEEKEQEKTKDKKDKDPEYLESELKKLIKQRDSLKSERRKLQERLKEFEERMKELPPKDEFEKILEEYNQLKEFKTELEKKREEEELAKKSEEERMKIRFEKEKESLQKQFEQQMAEFKKLLEDREKELKERDSKIQRFREYRLEREILEIASKKAYNPKQIVKLLKDGFEYDENLDKFFYPVYDTSGKMKDELSVEERVNQFLNDPENDNLVRSDANTESIRSSQTQDKTGKLTGDYSPTNPKIIEEAKQHRMKPEDWAEIARLRDIKLGKIKPEEE